MNLIFIAALLAVCGAAKLDRTYLPPASAKTAGGAPGSLQTPFAGNSFTENNGLPKGSFTNEFQGVVVDAATAGTRASGEGETGLGGSRISYGSTDSRVGEAAFRGTAAGFRPFPGQNFNRQSAQAGQNFDESNAQNGQNYNGQNGQGFHGQGSQNGQSFDGQSEQNINGQSQNFDGQLEQNFGSQAQGSQPADGQTASTQLQSQGFNGPNAQVPQFNQANRGPSRFESKPERAQAAFDRTASTLRFENEVGPESYHYAFETDNGISAEENGVATNGVQAQGGFSYTGDDGQVYTVTYTADEGGYQPRGDHLPTPPPIPEEILKALAKNAQDEAAGLVDDGSYDAQKYNAGSDYAESDSANVEHNDGQAPTFGRRPEADATASGTFINQNNQAFGQPGQEDGSSAPQDGPNDSFGSNNNNRFEQTQPARNPSNGAFGSGSNGFGQSSQASRPSANDATFESSNNFGQGPQPTRTPTHAPAVAPSNGFGSRKEYLPPVNGVNQKGAPQRPFANNGQSTFGFNGVAQASASASIGQPQVNQGSQSSSSFGRPSSNRLEVLAQGSSNEGPSGNTEAESAPNANNLAQAGQPSREPSQTFGSRIEYLPPSFGQNTRPQGLRPQRPTQSADATAAPSFNAASQASGSFQPGQQGQQSSSASAFVSGNNAQPSQQFNGFGQQRPQSFNNQFTQNRFPSAQKEQSATEGSGDQSDESHDEKASNTFGANQRPTSQPSTELTTPFESNERIEQTSTTGAATSSGFGAQSPSRRPVSKFESQSNNGPLNPSRPQNQATGSQSQTSFASQGQSQFSFPGNQPTTQTGFDHNESQDAQFSPSSERPSFGQNPDQSYYYRQPAKPFNTPGSRFPAAPSGQFNRLNQQSAQSSAQFGSPQNIPVNAFQSQSQNVNRGSTRFPAVPTLAPIAPTDSTDAQFQSTISSQYNGITQASISPFQPQRQGSTKYPRPPTLAPTAPTQATQFNGITQATASSFASASSSAPFGTRPTFQQSSFNQPQPSQPTKPFAPQSDSGDESSQPEVPTQQYNGEIYEYSKPPQGLPAPAQKDMPSPQRVQNFASQRPQFGSQGITAQQSDAQPQPTRPFGARPQPQRTQPGFTAQSTSQDQPAQDSKQQFSAPTRPFAQSENQGASASQTRPKCCQSLDAKIESFRESSQNNVGLSSAQGQFGNQFAAQQGSSGQGQFGSQFSGPTAQPGSQSFAGRGESFGGPRKPPSFDDQTGYHY